jgi:hypothetical protein
MCGACGRVTVPDPVLGPVRTIRQHLIVAQTINTVCAGLPGAPKVTALADGWLTSGPSGGTLLCPTVEELWTAILLDRPNQLHPRADLSAARDHTPADGGDLAYRVVALGHRLAQEGDDVHVHGSASAERTKSEPHIVSPILNELIAEITAKDATRLQHELNSAVTTAQVKAMEQREHGILVTRHDYGSFTVEISPEVPYGLTREGQADWRYEMAAYSRPPEYEKVHPIPCVNLK